MSTETRSLSVKPASQVDLSARWSNQPVSVIYQGETRQLRVLCAEKQIAFTTVWGRLKKGWAVDAALDTPTRLPSGALVKVANGYQKISTLRKALHIQIAEAALGKPLPAGAEVHHVNGIKTDNRPENLVVCPNHAYHALLHARMRAMDSCGNPNFRRCEICGEWDDPSRMYQRKSKAGCWHRECGNKARNERKQRSTQK